eukprot:g3017.t1
MRAPLVSPFLVITLAGLPVCHAFSRYHPSPDVFLAKDLAAAAANGEVTPISSYPQQDLFYKVLAFSHAYLALPCVALFVVQWIRRKGDETHVAVGKFAKLFALFMIVQGLVLQVRHSFFTANPYETFSDRPAVFPLEMAQYFVSAFGLTTASSTVQAFFVGVKPASSSRVALGSAAFWSIAGLLAASITVTALAYIYMFGQLVAEPVLGNYVWEINFEMVVIGVVFPVYDLCNAWALLGWYSNGKLHSWLEHQMGPAKKKKKK